MYIFLILILLILIMMLPEQDHIWYHMSCFGSSKNKKGLPTPSPIRTTVQRYLDQFTPNYTIIDFGCGDGDMIELFQPRFDHVIGIEMDIEQANHATSRFASHNNVSIHAIDIMTYTFRDIPTIVYLYEPLWTLSKDEARPIYQTVLSNLTHVSHHYLIYVSGIHQQLSESYFATYGYVIVSHDRHSRFFGIACNHMYLLQYQP